MADVAVGRPDEEKWNSCDYYKWSLRHNPLICVQGVVTQVLGRGLAARLA